MSDQDEYEALLDTIRAIADDQVVSPNMPIDNYVQEAENLLHWVRDDEALLTQAGLDWAMVLSIGPRAAACRRAQAIWTRARFIQQEAAKQWEGASEQGYDLRANLLHDFYYAFYDDASLSKRVSEIAEGHGHADMIQDLSDIAELGRANEALLLKIGFDPSQLQLAEQQSHDLAELLARATGDRRSDNETLVIRNQAYTYLKEAVDKLRRCGQYLFWRDEKRLVGYVSQYRRKQRREQIPSVVEIEPQESNA